jgi:hypothetical protein
MSDRGLILALQRFHDDPGFYDRVKTDPQNTLGIYDLDEEQCDALIDAVVNDKHEEITQLAQEVGMDWQAPRVSGVGALSDEEIAVEAPTTPAAGTPGPGGVQTYNQPSQGTDTGARPSY